MEINDALENRALQNEISRLDREARELEAWLLENTQDPDFEKQNILYDDVLFRLASKRLRKESLEKGYTVPKTYSMPGRVNKSQDFK